MWYLKAMRLKLSLILLCGGFLLTCSSSEEFAQVSRSQCEAVQKHRAALRMKNVKRKTKLSTEDLQKHEANFARVTEDNLEACMQARTGGWATCMLKLESLGQEDACD